MADAQPTLPALGVFSPYTLMLHHDATGESDSSLLKRAAILFDKLVFFPRGLGPVDEPGAIISKDMALLLYAREDIEQAIRKDYLDLFLLDKDVLDDEEKFYGELQSFHADDLWFGDHSSIFVSWVEDLVERRAPATGDDLRSMRVKWEEQKYFIGNINADCKLMRLVNERLAGCSGLFSELHEAAILAVHGVKDRTSQDVLDVVSDVGMVDFGRLTWPQIIELRRSGFVKDFRRRIAGWIAEYVESQSDPDFESSLRRFTDEALFELVGATEPSVGRTVLAAICGNLPSPILVNPIGVAAGASEIRRALRLKKDFGWLYFIQRARRLAARSDSGGVETPGPPAQG